MSVSCDSSRRSASQCASSANFVALYAIRIGMTTFPRMLEHCTMRPRPPCARIAFTARRVRSCHPKKFTSKMARSASVGMSSAAPPLPCAPLLNSASNVPPVSRMTSSKPRSIVSGLE